MVLLLACGLGASALVADARRQDPAATFRSSVDVVDVDVSVLDSNRLPVTGLTAADFTVLEDNQPRPIVAFAPVDLPPRTLPSARWMSTIAPDVLDNDLQREGRLVAIVIDQSIAPEHLPDAQRFAESVVDQLRPGDLAAVVYSTFGVPQNFTADRARLLAAIRQPAVGLPASDAGSPSMCRCGTCSLETVAEVAEALAPVRQRRKMLLIVGSNIAIQSAGSCGGLLTPLRRRAFRALEDGNVTVHAFDPVGLPTLAFAASSASGGRSRGVAAHMARRGNLSILPDRTGGRLVSDPVRPADRVAEIFRESNAYYVLGFQPAHPERDGKFHEIRIRVNRPDVTLQARRGYYGGGRAAQSRREAIDPTLSRELREAVAGLWPSTGVSLAVTAAPVASLDLGRSSVASVVRVRHLLDAGDMEPIAADDAQATPAMVNVLTGAFDREGRELAWSRQTVLVTPERTAARQFEYEIVSRLDLDPGRYELRTAVEDTRFGRTGSVYTYVDVPDFRRAPVSLSGLIVSATPTVTRASSSSLDGLVPVVPTTRRSFGRGDRATGFVRLYQGVSRALMPGYVVAEILDERDASVFRQETRVVSGQYGASRALDFSVDIPLARLEPGQYVLTIEARHGNESARREMRFAVHE
jgi:VWFA-related protein